jgi:catalase
MRNLQRDGQRRMEAVPGRVAYEPNSLDPSGPREDHERGFRTFAPQAGQGEIGDKLRIRPESFADHYSQARQFYRSMTPPEQRHIQQAFSFELAKVETSAIRNRVLGHLHIVDETLANAVEADLGVEGQATAIKPFREPIDLPASPALSLIGRFKPTLKGRKVGVLLTEGFDAEMLDALREAVVSAGAELAVIAPKIGEVKAKKGAGVKPDMALSGAPSVLFDALALLAPAEGIAMLTKNATAVDWLRDAYGHLKVIGILAETDPLFAKAGLTEEKNGDEGIVRLDSKHGMKAFVEAAKNLRVWAREERM